MDPFLWQQIKYELIYGTQQAWRLIVPKPQDRTPITWSQLPIILTHCLPYLFLGYLVRRPGTYLIRLLLLPGVFATTARMWFAYTFEGPSFGLFNLVLGFGGMQWLSKVIEFALVPEGRLKVGEEVPGAMSTDPAAPTGDKVFQPRWLFDGVEVICAMRGLAWDFGQTVFVPKETRSVASRTAFLISTLNMALINYLYLDFADLLFKLVPGVGSVEGGSIFFQDLPPLQRYVVSSALTTLTAVALVASFNLIYYTVNIIAVGALGHSPLIWPPAMGNPWRSESLADIWGRKWHQFLRQTFLIYGGYPGQYLAGGAGMVLGAFIASGMYHECSFYMMNRGWDPRVMIFFTLQGVIVILERVWRIVTGYKVGGWAGSLWTGAVMLVSGHLLVDSWLQRGLGGALIIPPVASPARQILIPLVRSTYERLAAANGADISLPETDLLRGIYGVLGIAGA